MSNFTDFKLKWGEKIAQEAQALRVDPNVLGGVLLTESGGTGFVDGKMIIRFEASWFNHLSAEDGNADSGLFMCDSSDSRYRALIRRIFVLTKR